MSDHSVSPPAPRPRSPLARRVGFTLIPLTIAGGLLFALAAGDLGKNLVYYWTPKDLRAAGDQAYGATVRLCIFRILNFFHQRYQVQILFLISIKFIWMHILSKVVLAVVNIRRQMMQ